MAASAGKVTRSKLWTWPFGFAVGLSTWLLPATDAAAQTRRVSSTTMIAGFGWSVDLAEPARNGLDLMLLTSAHGFRPTMVTSIRFGRYSPEGLLGSARAEADGFAPDRRRDFVSLFFGVQSPAPFLAPRLGFYSRLSAGFTTYLGQPFREAGPGQDPALDYQRQIAPRWAPGLELGIGVRNVSPGHGVGLRTEFRLGLEHVSRAGIKMIRPTLVIGADVPLRFR
jgi:hypothetical protein